MGKRSKPQPQQLGKGTTPSPVKVTPSLSSWRTLIAHMLNNGQLDEAGTALGKALDIYPDDAMLLQLQGQLEINRGNDQLAIVALERALSINPRLSDTHFFLSIVLKQGGKLTEALVAINQALVCSPSYAEYRFHKSTILADMHQYNASLEILDALLSEYPDSARYWNNAGIQHNALGHPETAQKCFQRALSIEPGLINAFSNYLTSLHYDPKQSRETVFKACQQWEHHTSAAAQIRPKTVDPSPCRPLKIGLISDGFRTHPVGRMIIAALEKLPPHSYDFFAYSSNGSIDQITKRFQKLATAYTPVMHLSDTELAKLIRDDKIDILIDLAGYNNGSRIPVMMQRPAPVQVKWVGGLINTTGLTTIDYLISDHVETPLADDSFYTEKLIRMPGDYICYELPDYTPTVTPLPAKKNKYITLGCFNNPMKLNVVILEQWALIMHELPNSTLFLKGSAFNSEALRHSTVDVLQKFGIAPDRIIIEGFSPHKELLGRYNQVDIALDPWPYSGGLTTCEAFAMGVPVVTMPGPTFAGRHSATHLVNAGMPELVTHSWDEYRERVIELASDLDSLATIRSHLRTILLQSPVCDADTFAGHLNNALRAIWQRYTEEKEPAALSFTKQGEVLFEGDSAPIQLQHPEAPVEAEDETFKWEFEGKVIAIDHGAQLFDVPIVRQMLEQGTLELIAFDPASNRLKHPLRQANSVHYYPNILLGNGQANTLYACQDPKLSGTLKPLDEEYFTQELQQGLSPLAELPVNSLALDKVNELPSIDWLILDNLNNSVDVLEHGSEALKNTLLVHADIAFQPTHARQPNFAEVSHWAARHGFRFYCFCSEENRTQVPQTVIGANHYANELTSATALFIPSHQRMQALTDSQRMKLAYLTDGVYGLKGLSYEVLSTSSTELADTYMTYNTNQLKAEKQPHIPTGGKRVTPRIQHAPSPEKPSTPLVFPPPESAFDWHLQQPISVVDIGANPIDGTPPYRELLDQGHVNLVGFEPQTEALEKLNQQKGPHETYLPYAVGDGTAKTLYLCQAEGMTSTLAPNVDLLNRFQGYPVWAKVKQEVPITTYRLDDIEQVPPVDWLKIDIQGGELSVFQNAEEKLKNCLVIQTEVNFVPLYKNQPLFAEIDQWMRARGFMLHTLLEQRKRLFAPMVINNQIHQGINQLTTADAVYVKSFESLQQLDSHAIEKLACIMHEAYGSYDYVASVLGAYSCKDLQISFEKYMKSLT